jgi:hypothetical protein
MFIALKNLSPWPDFEPATFVSSGQHTNHYTTKAIDFNCNFSKSSALTSGHVGLKIDMAHSNN